MKQQIAVLILPLAFLACSTKPAAVSNEAQGEAAPTTQASMEAKQVAAEQETPYVTEIDFNKGSAQLNPAARLKLERLLAKVQTNENIEAVKVISWADQEYPADRKESLPKTARDLAEKRNETVENFIERVNADLDVDTLSMAERPNELTKFLGTSDARLKESLETSGIALSGTSTDAQSKGPSKASKAIVMLILKNSGQ